MTVTHLRFINICPRFFEATQGISACSTFNSVPTESRIAENYVFLHPTQNFFGLYPYVV